MFSSERCSWSEGSAQVCTGPFDMNIRRFIYTHIHLYLYISQILPMCIYDVSIFLVYFIHECFMTLWRNDIYIYIPTASYTFFFLGWKVKTSVFSVTREKNIGFFKKPMFFSKCLILLVLIVNWKTLNHKHKSLDSILYRPCMSLAAWGQNQHIGRTFCDFGLGNSELLVTYLECRPWKHTPKADVLLYTWTSALYCEGLC